MQSYAKVIADNQIAYKVFYNKRDRCFFAKFISPETGKNTSKNIPVSCSTEAEAETWLCNYLSRFAATKVAPTNQEVRAGEETMVTLFTRIQKYWTEAKTNKDGDKILPKTASNWIAKLNGYILVDPIAQIPLIPEKFTAIACSAFVERIKQLKVAKYTIRDIVFVARLFIADARKKGWCSLPFNPFADEIVRSDVPAGHPISGKDNPIHLSKEAAIALISCESTRIPDWRKLKNLLALTTGLRDGEIQALRWQDVDLDKRCIVIDRQLVRGGLNPNFGGCKKGSERTVPIHPLTKQAFVCIKRTRPDAKASDPIFPDPATGLYARLKSADQFRADLRAAGLSDQYQGKFAFDFHATRRTFLTLLEDAGVPEGQANAISGQARKGVRKHYVAAHIETFLIAIEKLPFETIQPNWCKL